LDRLKGCSFARRQIHWVIVGGESGKDRRDCGEDAITDIANQCFNAGVPCFVKQDCAFKPGQQGRIPNVIWALKQFPRVAGCTT
jgi:protein gp37